jgi:probable HAF family extracellular repeat protein
VSSHPATAVTPYTITDLGSFGGNSYAYAINESGQVTGWSQTAGGDPHAFLWDNGVMRNLGVHYGYDINASAQVVGGHGQLAFLWENNSVRYLSTLGGASSVAYAINDSGQVVGMAYTPSGDRHAFLWEDGVVTDLGTLGGSRSEARGINALGQVVGMAYDENERYRAFLWEDGVMHNLGTLGGVFTYAHDINVSGQVAGSSCWSGFDYHAFLWQDGVMHDLGTLGGDESHGFGINASAQIVGRAWDASGDQLAFLWEDGVMHKLNNLIPADSGWDLTTARGINDLGQIVGSGFHNGEMRAFLLTPIPEPSAPGLLILGALGLLARKKTRSY